MFQPLLASGLIGELLIVSPGLPKQAFVVASPMFASSRLVLRLNPCDPAFRSR